MKLIAGATLIALLLVDFLEFHDLFEPHTFVEYMTGAISIPLATLLIAHLVGWARWDVRLN